VSQRAVRIHGPLESEVDRGPLLAVALATKLIYSASKTIGEPRKGRTEVRRLLMMINVLDNSSFGLEMKQNDTLPYFSSV
jgi:hypothetical protein